MSDMIWLRSEQEPFMDVEIVSEGAREVVYKRAGKTVTVAAKDVVQYRRGDTPEALDHALVRMEKGDFKAADKLLAPLTAKEGWVRAHACFHRANARRLLAELEGTGFDEALALLKECRELEAEHYLAPFVAIVTGDTALAAKNYALAKAEFTRLASYGDHAKLASRLGLARVKLAAAPKEPAEALAELEAIEKDAYAAVDMDTFLVARIARATAMGKKDQAGAKEGLGLLLPLLNTTGMVASPWHGAVLNTVVELIADFAGRNEDGSAKKTARLAASYFANRAVRYTSAHPVERAKTLALAYEINTLGGRNDIALMVKTELGRRYPTSTYAKAL